jgi:hypothetical protein
MLRNFYGGVAASLKEGRKVQQLIDDHIRSLAISKLMDVREITDETREARDKTLEMWNNLNKSGDHRYTNINLKFNDNSSFPT